MTIGHNIKRGVSAAVQSLRTSRRRADKAPHPASADVARARTLGRNFAKTCLDLQHPRVMTAEFQFQELRTLRNHVRNTAPGALGEFNRDREAPLYEAFLAGVLDHCVTRGYVRTHRLASRD